MQKIWKAQKQREIRTKLFIVLPPRGDCANTLVYILSTFITSHVHVFILYQTSFLFVYINNLILIYLPFLIYTSILTYLTNHQHVLWDLIFLLSYPIWSLHTLL